jgi:hypothetical protein
METKDRIYIPPRRRQLPIDHYHPEAMLGAVIVGICLAGALIVIVWALVH